MTQDAIVRSEPIARAPTQYGKKHRADAGNTENVIILSTCSKAVIQISNRALFVTFSSLDKQNLKVNILPTPTGGRHLIATKS